MLVYAGIGALQQTSWQIARYVSSIHLPYVPRAEVLIFMGIGCLVLGFAIYRLSLPAHAQFGELFKSIFDMYRSKLTFDDIIKVVSEITQNPLLICKSRQEKNEIAFMYLRWHRILNEETGNYQTVGEWQNPTGQNAASTPPDGNPTIPGQ